MAVTTEIPWDDGSGDKIYLTRNASEGDQVVQVSSDANSGAARTKVVTFTSGVGNIQRQLTINQAAGTISPVFYTYLKFDGTAMIQTDYVLPSGCSLRVPTGWESQKKAQTLFVSKGGTGRISVIYGGATSTTRRQVVPCYDSASALATNRYLNFTYTSFLFFMTSKRFGWGTTSYTYTKGSVHPTDGICFGGGGATAAFTGAMRTFEVYGSETQDLTNANAFDNYTPIATFRPCIYNGEAGMWHVEENKFYGNTAGSGTLIATDVL